MLRQLIPPNTVVRWARRSKVPELSLIGYVTSVEWTDTLRNGGGYVFMISYKDEIYPHHECLSHMYADYKKYIEHRVSCIDDVILTPPPMVQLPRFGVNHGPIRRKRRKPRKHRRRLKVPVAANINSSRDLSFHLNGTTWSTLGALVPNKVRMLFSPYAEDWLLAKSRSLVHLLPKATPAQLERTQRVEFVPSVDLPPLGNFLESPAGPSSVPIPDLSLLLDAIEDPSSWLDPDLDYLLDAAEDIDFDEFDRYLTSIAQV